MKTNLILIILFCFIGGCSFCHLETEDTTLTYWRWGNQNLPAVIYENGEFLIEGQRANNDEVIEALVKEISILTTLLKGM